MHESLNKNPEAKRLEEDYITRLRQALLIMPDLERRQIVEDVREHIRATLTEQHGGSEIGLTQMAAVLEELGPPEEMARDPLEERAEPGSPPPAVSPSETVPADRKDQLGDRLDGLFAAFAVIILGLYVPFIDLHVCAIIGTAMLVFFLGRMAKEPELEGIGKARPLVIVSLISTILIFPLGTLSLAGGWVEIVADLMTLPVAVAQVICDLCAYWIIMGTLAKLAARSNAAKLADKVRRRRIGYLMYNFIMLTLALLLGVVLAVNKVDGVALEVMLYGLLPLNWIAGWIFVLAPLRAVRRLLLEP